MLGACRPTSDWWPEHTFHNDPWGALKGNHGTAPDRMNLENLAEASGGLGESLLLQLEHLTGHLVRQGTFFCSSWASADSEHPLHCL